MIDLVIILLTALSMIIGARKGFFDASNTIISVLISAYFGLVFRHYIPIVEVVGFIIVFSISWLVVYSILKFITKIAGMKINKLLGSLFGGFLSWFIMSLFFIGLNYYPIIHPNYLRESKLYPIVYQTAGNIIGISQQGLRNIQRQIYYEKKN